VPGLTGQSRVSSLNPGAPNSESRPAAPLRSPGHQVAGVFLFRRWAGHPAPELTGYRVFDYYPSAPHVPHAPAPEYGLGGAKCAANAGFADRRSLLGAEHAQS